MRNVSVFMFVAFLSCGCKPTATDEFQPKSSELLKAEYESFIEKYPWQEAERAGRPFLAATRDELKHLKKAWRGNGPEHDVLAERFAEADKAMELPLVFPPEGGQHNQWYQCTDCQIGLQTVDDYHHKCPQCQKVYSGFPYDNVIYGRKHSHNISIAEDAAWAWTVTGERKYARFAADILLGYADRYLKYPMVHASVNDKSIDVGAHKNDLYQTAGHIMEQTLNESMLMIPVVTAYDLIYGSDILKAEDRKMIEESLIRAMAECINVYKSGKSNWQTWHNTALLYAGITLGDNQMVSQALLDKDNGFIAQMNISVMPEGMWYENSWGYHYYTLNALTLMAEAGRRIGLDIYSHEMLHKMYFIAFDYLMADGSLPRFGDSVNDSPYNQSVNEMAYNVYRDERLLPRIHDKPAWDMIMFGRKEIPVKEDMSLSSHLIQGAGHAILATDGPGKLTAAITFGPYGGFHGHFDKLSFVMFGFGQELGVDPGRAASQAYRLPVHGEWYKATTGHNAVLVDGKSQGEAKGELLSFAATDSYAAVAAYAGPAFTNIDHRRFLLLTQTYMLVVDELEAKDGKVHSFDWLYHNKGLKTSCNLTVNKLGPGEITPGYAYLKDISSYKVKTEKTTEVEILSDQLTTRLTMPALPGDEVFTSTGPLKSITDRAPMIIVRRNGKKVFFISVIEPVPAQKDADICRIELPGGWPHEIIIGRRSGEDRIKFEGESLGTFKVFNKSGTSGEQVVLDPGTNQN